MLVSVTVAWAPPGYEGVERTIWTQASSSNDLYVQLGEALAREALWWDKRPGRTELLVSIRSIKLWAEPGESAADWLENPPELVRGYDSAFNEDD